jgi:hypothetical protein
VALQSLKDLGRLTYRRFLELFRYGMTPWTSDQPVARPLPTQDNATQKDADKHPCVERDSNPRSRQPTGQDPRLRPHGHCDRRRRATVILIINIVRQQVCFISVSYFPLSHYIFQLSSTIFRWYTKAFIELCVTSVMVKMYTTNTYCAKISLYLKR